MWPGQTDHENGVGSQDEAGDPGKRWEASLQTEDGSWFPLRLWAYVSASILLLSFFIFEDWDPFQILITSGLSLQEKLPHTQSHTNLANHFTGQCCSAFGPEEASSDQIIAH